MSVQSKLGFGPTLDPAIVDSWNRWVEQRPALAAVPDPRQLRAWVAQVDPEVADAAVHALAWLASVEGGDDLDAAQALAWLLIPGASFVARQLQTLTPTIDHVVASELWIRVRTFPLHRRKVIANLMADLRRRVLETCEAPATLRRTDPTWFATGASLESEAIQSRPVEHTPTALEELVDVLDWACAHRVIRAGDRQLLLWLVEATRDLGVRISDSHGLLATEATAQIAARLGVCERTVRRRVRRSIAKLAAAAPAYTRAA